MQLNSRVMFLFPYTLVIRLGNQCYAINIRLFHFSFASLKENVEEWNHLGLYILFELASKTPRSEVVDQKTNNTGFLLINEDRSNLVFTS